MSRLRLLRQHPGFFDSDHYLSGFTGPHRLLAKLAPLRHYLAYGWRRGHDPHPLFDVRHYLFAYPDVAAAGVEPLTHYIASGAAEARRPNPLLKPDHYVPVNPAATLQTAFTHADTPQLRARLAHGRLRVEGNVRRIIDYARATGQRVIAQPQPAHVEWTSPVIINRAMHAARLQAPLPQPYVAVLRDMTAFPGTRLLLSPDRQILHDELGADNASLFHDKLKAIGNFADGVCRVSAATIGLTLPRALLISSDTDFNYFHLVIEALPRLALAAGAGCPIEVPILVQGDLHPNLIAALERAAGGREIVYAPWGSGVEVAELWYVGDLSRVLNRLSGPSDVAYDIAMSPKGVQAARALILPQPAPPAGRKKIYISRNSTIRHLSNQDDFITLLKTKGFEIIDTGAMTLDQQIAAMGAAALVIAPSGAALTNLLWCASDTRILILMADHPQLNLHLFNQVGEALGLDVQLYLGNRIYDMNNAYSFHDSFEADLNVISEWCDRQTIHAR